MDNWHVEPWTKDHDRSSFVSGKQPLDDFFRSRVSQYEKRRLGKTFVAVLPGDGAGRRVIGYYTLAAGAISLEELPRKIARKLPQHPVPIVLLAHLAVDKPHQGKGVGEGLLLDALQRSLALSAKLGIHAVAVEAIDESAASFYKKFGFISLQREVRHLFLPITTVEKVLGWDAQC